MESPTNPSTMEATIERRPWDEFRNTRMLWWVNRMIHLFGWVIIVELDESTGKITDAFPARTKWRGFDQHFEAAGFKLLTEHLMENKEMLLAAVRD